MQDETCGCLLPTGHSHHLGAHGTLPATWISCVLGQRPLWEEELGPVATIQKSVLRAIREEVRPKRPASRARERQGSMDTALAFYFLWVKTQITQTVGSQRKEKVMHPDSLVL